MKKPRVQQRTERRISAALRLVLVAVLLVAQIALVLLLSTVLKQRAALAYTALELVAFVCAVYIWTKPGTTSYKVGWIFLILFSGVRLQAGREPPEHRKAAAEHAPVGSAGVLSEQ